MGLEQCDAPEQADVVVLNTCVVRQTAEDTATGMLGKLKPGTSANPGRVLAVMGCMVGPTHQELSRRFPQVHVWARPQQFEPILKAVERSFGGDADGCLANLVPAAPGVASFVPIVHGCDKFCSFCIIPYRRGRETSRAVDDIVHEIELLVARGVKEVTLLGQNVDSFGHDLRPRADLADLLARVHDIAGLERIRFLTSHPNDMSSRIIRAVRDLPKVCESVNLPFQAGDDKVLADMRRGYTRSQYLEKVAEIREVVPSTTLTTDLIVGFPGETSEQFDRSLDILESVRFDKVHAAMYSERPGTAASRTLPDELSPAEKKRRLALVNELQEPIQARLNSAYGGREFDVLLEGITRGRPQGRTRGDKLVYVGSASDGHEHRADTQSARLGIGETVKIRITETTPWSLAGEIATLTRNASATRQLEAVI